MKKLSLLLVACFIAQSGFSQAQNGVKVGLQNFLWSTIAYERSITDNFSLEAEYGHLLGSRVFSDLLTDFEVIDNNGNTQTLDSLQLNGRNIELEEIKFRGRHLSIEGRFYPGDEAIKGFYIGPYVAFTSHGVRDASGMDDLGNDYSGKFLLNTVNAGGQLGWNWVLGGSDSGFLIDLTLVGGSVGFTNTKFGYTTTDTTIDFEDQKAEIEAENNLDDIPFSAGLNVTALDNGLEINTRGISAFGRIQISIGYAF